METTVFGCGCGTVANADGGSVVEVILCDEHAEDKDVARLMRKVSARLRRLSVDFETSEEA